MQGRARRGVWIVLLLAGCGGGGDGTPAGPAPAADLSAYVGTWQGPCAGRAAPRLSFAASGVAGALTKVDGVDYFAVSGCSGEIVASLTHAPASVATFRETQEVPVLGPRPGVTIPLALDVFDVEQPQRTGTMVGASVGRGTDIDGNAAWCFDHADGSSCVFDAGPEAAASSVVRYRAEAGLLYRPVPTGTAYELGPPSTRR
jgi:hypothetical protein